MFISAGVGQKNGWLIIQTKLICSSKLPLGRKEQAKRAPPGLSGPWHMDGTEWSPRDECG